MEEVFQVEFYKALEEGFCFVDGRFIEGRVLCVNDTFSLLKCQGVEQIVQYVIVEIQMYQKKLTEINVGMTARLVLQGKGDKIEVVPFELWKVMNY